MSPFPLSTWIERDILFIILPQWSVLFLFVLYIDDLPDWRNNVCKMYADENKVIAVKKYGVENKLQEDINNTFEWCIIWLMRLDGSKCKVVRFGRKNPKKKHLIEENGNRKFSEQLNAGVNRASWILDVEIEEDIN
ncbi:RNA-directed DNA polymerase from mobile element jockey-like [Brachionus plicatilis]|uniref:RNA-directed DNA polymerase from mobile element jockey-like n=1 Tax=Brachionus plicatilis TaxID=10195 RepID=A0A3M7R6K4_BRAPC|nr:RNA-directed DNA polymerase from mobile element jockey-like [Brachionus plicatilis]